MEHRFFHVDIGSRLVPGQEIVQDAAGLSMFGRYYLPAITQTKPLQTWDDADRREVRLELVRQMKFQWRLSRLSAFFAALTMAGAERYTRRFRPAPGAAIASEVRVFEVFGTRFEMLDMCWLDIAGLGDEQMRLRYEAYWEGKASSDAFGGVWREPLMEALIAGPVRVGEVVGHIKPQWGADAAPAPAFNSENSVSQG